MNNKEYANLTLEELSIEEKELKKKELISSVLIGILIGVLIFGVAKKGFGFLHIFLPLILMSGVYKQSQKHKHILKLIQAEISAKNSK